MADDEYFYKSVAKDYGSIEFKTAEDLSRWVKSELDFWKDCTKPDPAQVGFIDDKRNQFFSWIKVAHDLVNNYLVTKNAAQKQELETSLGKYLTSGLVSRSARASFIKNLEKEGEIVARAALGIYLGSAVDPHPERQRVEYRYAAFKGRIAMATFDAGISEGTGSAIHAAITQMVAEFSSRMEHLSSESDAGLALLKSSHDEFQKTRAAFEERSHLTLNASIEKAESEKDEAIKAINDVKASFLEFMQLKGPVEYWRTKATEHRTAAKKWMVGLIAHTVFGIALLGSTFWWSFNQAVHIASQSGQKESALFIALAVGFGLVATIVFWVARFVSRMYLSERHMGIDARHRSTLVETYLAMIAEKTASDTDRALILPAIFRATSDGIVQDDTSVDSLTAIAARLLEKK